MRSQVNYKEETNKRVLTNLFHIFNVFFVLRKSRQQGFELHQSWWFFRMPPQFNVFETHIKQHKT